MLHVTVHIEKTSQRILYLNVQVLWSFLLLFYLLFVFFKCVISILVFIFKVTFLILE